MCSTGRGLQRSVGLRWCWNHEGREEHEVVVRSCCDGFLFAGNIENPVLAGVGRNCVALLLGTAYFTDSCHPSERSHQVWIGPSRLAFGSDICWN